MNIFVLDRDPVTAARYHCDQHVCKMSVEYAQILCTVAHGFGVSPPYKPTHRNHPCVKWAAESSSNYRWLYQLFFATCAEYSARYHREHESSRKIRLWMSGDRANLVRAEHFSCQQHTPFVQAMPVQYRDVDAVIAYRRFYAHAKPFAKYRHSSEPVWLLEMRKDIAA